MDDAGVTAEDVYREFGKNYRRAEKTIQESLISTGMSITVK